MVKKNELAEINKTLRLILEELTKISSKKETWQSDVDECSDDELYEKAKEVMISVGKGSASLLQRRLKVGYARAARLLDMLEQNGVIGPADGATPKKGLFR